VGGIGKQWRERELPEKIVRDSEKTTLRLKKKRSRDTSQKKKEGKGTEGLAVEGKTVLEERLTWFVCCRGKVREVIWRG